MPSGFDGITSSRIECFINDERIVDQPLAGHALSIRDEVIPSKPLGIATYATTAQLKNIRWRPVAPATPAAESSP